jgi:hypothetical protein
MGEIIMNEKLKEKLAKAAELCTDAVFDGIDNSERRVNHANAAELLTKAILNLSQTECYIPHFNEMEPAPRKMVVSLN